MRPALFLVLLLALTAVIRGADADELVREGLAAEAKLESARALALFRQADALKPDNAFILQKIAKQYSDMVPDQPTNAAKKEFALQALGYAERSFALEPSNAVYALSPAICHGHLALVGDIRAKVEMSRVIKAEAERALELDPLYAWAHHILGRWHVEVADLNGLARFAARVLYGAIPPASLEEGVRHLQRATELEPGELNHWIDLGFAYAAAGRNPEARAAWERGLAMPDASRHDRPAKERARASLAALR
jgi:tetratricopeptide (TPR) repeat protein